MYRNLVIFQQQKKKNCQILAIEKNLEKHLILALLKF
jgi:hypothetical protein